MLTAETSRRRLLDHQLGVLHVLGEGGLLCALGGIHLDDGLEVREDLVAHERQHLVGAELPEVRPAQVLLVIGEDALEGLLRCARRASRCASR